MPSFTKLGYHALADYMRHAMPAHSSILIDSRWPPRYTNGVVDRRRHFRAFTIDALHAVDDRIVAAWDRDIVPRLPEVPGQMKLVRRGGTLIINGNPWWPDKNSPLRWRRDWWGLYVRNVTDPDDCFAMYQCWDGRFVLGDNAIRSS